MIGTALGRLNGLCRRRSAVEEFKLRPLVPLIVLTTALAQGTSIGAPQGAGTPLHEASMPATEAAMAVRKAATRESTDIVLLTDVPLIAACANPLALASLENSPLHWAACNQDPTVLGPLIEAGADLEAWNLHGLTPLQFAAYINPNPAIIRTLLEAGADPEAVTDNGWTAGDLVQENPDLKGFGARLRLR